MSAILKEYVVKEKKEREIAMFGETVETMLTMFHAMNEDNTMDMSMYAMSILSDAQHVMENNPEKARQFINKAKYFLSEIHTEARGLRGV